MQRFLLRGWLASLALCLLATLPGCGGGGSGSDASNASARIAVSYPPSTALLSDANVAAITVESGPGNNVNIPYVTVTVCSPGGVAGSSNCKDIDHVLLDTGSTGLRLFASDVEPALTLPAQRIGSSATITECSQFLKLMAWGSVKLADVVIGGKRAPSVPVQLMDSSFPAALSAGTLCGTSPVITQHSTIGANGILGVSLFAYDGQTYFDCAPPVSASCKIIPQPATHLQVQNPVTLFDSDNNGVVVQLPAVPANGARSAQGFLIFGVATQANNTLGSANMVQVSATTGYFTTTYKGRARQKSFIDSGSNGLYFNDASLSTRCSSAASGFYCPGSTQDLTATITLSPTSSVAVNFSIGNADQLFPTANYAFSNLGGTLDNSSFDWGLPFFFGRTVYTVVEGSVAGGLTGPFYAFTN